MAQRYEDIDPWIRDLLGGRATVSRRIKPSRYSLTGYVAGGPGSKAQAVESTLEHDFVTLLKFDHRVHRYLTQPFTIHWKDAQGRRRAYTPDVICSYKKDAIEKEPYLKTTIFEVKPKDVLKADWVELKPKFRAAIGWAKELDCRFHLVTETQIRTPFLTNARFLLRYTNEAIFQEGCNFGEKQWRVRTSIHKLGQSTPRELLEYMAKSVQERAELIPLIWNCINLQVVGADLSKPLNMESSIWTLEKEVI